MGNICKEDGEIWEKQEKKLGNTSQKHSNRKTPQRIGIINNVEVIGKVRKINLWFTIVIFILYFMMINILVWLKYRWLRAVLGRFHQRLLTGTDIHFYVKSIGCVVVDKDRSRYLSGVDAFPHNPKTPAQGFIQFPAPQTPRL